MVLQFFGDIFSGSMVPGSCCPGPQVLGFRAQGFRSGILDLVFAILEFQGMLV
jgi:hypothetical protein